MTRMTALTMAAAIALGSNAAVAAGYGADRASLDHLSPEVREKVMHRMGPGQRLDELIETTRLNEAAAEGFAGTEDTERFERMRADRPWLDGDSVRSSDRYSPHGETGGDSR